MFGAPITYQEAHALGPLLVKCTLGTLCPKTRRANTFGESISTLPVVAPIATTKLSPKLVLAHPEQQSKQTILVLSNQQTPTVLTLTSEPLTPTTKTVTITTLTGPIPNDPIGCDSSILPTRRVRKIWSLVKYGKRFISTLFARSCPTPNYSFGTVASLRADFVTR